MLLVCHPEVDDRGTQAPDSNSAFNPEAQHCRVLCISNLKHWGISWVFYNYGCRCKHSLVKRGGLFVCEWGMTTPNLESPNALSRWIYAFMFAEFGIHLAVCPPWFQLRWQGSQFRHWCSHFPRSPAGVQFILMYMRVESTFSACCGA